MNAIFILIQKGVMKDRTHHNFADSILFSFFTSELLVFILEQYIESSECSIYPGDVLLQIHFIFIGEF